MKLGLGLYKSLLNSDNFRFAKQAGTTHIVAQLVDYVKGGKNPSLTQNYLDGWGVTENENKLWNREELVALRQEVESHDLTLAAIENFDPSHWFDILLNGPKKAQQMENIKQTIKIVGQAGIPVIGYYFSLAGVWGWSSGPTGRGHAKSVEFEASKVDLNTPIPNGMVWNMTYNPQAEDGVVSGVTKEEIWGRLSEFLKIMVPVAEENGVRLACHPDDPPLPEIRNTARLIHEPGGFDQLLGVIDSQSNGIEFCMGTTQEMGTGDIYECLDKYSAMNKICYVHFRNVKGKVPHYREAFVDEGDIDMIRALKILKKNNFDGVIIPDHTPEMTCDAPWHAGMAFALGYMKGAIQAINSES